MQFKRISQAITLLGLGLAATLLLAPRQAQAQWTATVGAQSPDQGQQALAFLPNEFWIHAGDTITWTSESDEIHTVTFLTASQKIPSFTAGCPGFAPGDAGIFDGSTCLSTQPITQGQTFKVTFPQAGTYKLICLVHNTMNATIHVLEVSAPLPHDQDFYDRTAASERRALLTDRDLGMAMGRQGDGDHDGDDGMTMQVLPATRHVTAGLGEIVATPGGLQTSSRNRFLQASVTIHAGDTVEWANHDPEEPHTITFGPEPAKLPPPSSNVTLDADGVRHATITSTGEAVHSGFISAAQVDDPGVLPQNPPGATRFRVTFKTPGVYDYICALHDNLGMVGRVIVLP